MTLGERLKTLRNESGHTLRSMSEKIDIPMSTISNYEQDFRRPDFETLGKFADFFDVSLDYLLARTDDPHGTDELPKKVYRLRKSLGKSKEEFAAMVNLTPDEVEAVEEGRLDEDKRWYVWISLIIGGLYERGLAKPKGELKTVPILGKVCAGNGSPAKEQILGYDYDPTGESDFILVVEGNSMSPLISDGEKVFVKWQSTANNNDLIVAYINGDDGVVRRYKRYDDVVILKPENPEYEDTVLNLKDNPSWGIIGVVLGKYQSFK